MLILSSKTARLLIDIFKALTVSTFTWEALSEFLKPDKMEWLLGFVVPASYVSSLQGQTEDFEPQRRDILGDSGGMLPGKSFEIEVL